MVTLAAQAIAAAGVNGAIESIWYWNPVTGTWVTTSPTVPFGSLIGAKAAMRNTGASDREMNMLFTLKRPNGLNKSTLIAPVVTVAPNGTYEQGWTDYPDIDGAWVMVIELHTSRLSVVGEGTWLTGTWTYVGGALDWNNMNDGSDATYLELISGNHDYNFAKLEQGDFISGISGVTLYFRILTFYLGGGHWSKVYPQCLIEGYLYRNQTPIYSTAGFTIQSFTWPKNPRTGQPWTKEELNSATFGLFSDSQSQWSEAYVIVT